MRSVKGTAYSRITLALDIIRKLDTGYHELNIIKQRINLCDEITIFDSDDTRLKCNFDDIPTDKNNICIMALDFIKEKCKIKKNVIIELVKNIPAGAGLAGGSSNGATTIMLLNQLWNLGMSKEDMIDIGYKIGMDVPYFFLGGTVFDTEGTCRLEELNKLPKMNVILINPGLHISTKGAYQNIDYRNIGKIMAASKMKACIKQGKINEALNTMHNDFENVIFPKYNGLEKIKVFLEENKMRALMSGSGSTVFGITPDYQLAEDTYKLAKERYQLVILTTTI